MTYTTETMLERARLKRKIRFWQGVGIVALCGIVLALGARFGVLDQEDHVARLSIEGVIYDDPERMQVLADLAEDDQVKALILRINSPGGTVVGGEALYGSLRTFSHTKPVVAVMGEVAASAGYMIALGADHIVARKGTVTGSIGVLMQSADLTGMLDKVGVKPVVIKSDPLKASPNPLEPMTPESEAANRAVIDNMYEMFLAMVIERRNMDPAQARSIADGRVYSGDQAHANGLVDMLGGESEARNWLQDNHNISMDLKVEEVVYGEEGLFSYAESLLSGSILNKTLRSQGLALDGLISVWHP